MLKVLLKLSPAQLTLCSRWKYIILYLSDYIEMVQKRALKSIYPGSTYVEVLVKGNLPTLSARRKELCRRYFNEMKKSDHKLTHLLPAVREVPYSLRASNTYPLIKARTDRYTNSFIPCA